MSVQSCSAPRAGFPRRRLPALLLLLLSPLAACAPQAPRYAAPVYATPGQAPAQEAQRGRVGLLLPLSGANRQLGQAMLNASQLALFDQGDRSIEFLPRDTSGTANGAAEAARSAIADGARALAGPLTLGETAAAAGPARAARAPMIAFTSDSAQAGGGVWVLGMTPAEQAERMAGAAAMDGARRIGLLAPDDEFGRRLAAALRTRMPELGLPAPFVVLHPRLGDSAQAARTLAEQAGPEGLDAVMLGLGGDRARVAAAALATALPSRPRFLGTASWGTDPGLAQEPALADAWFPGPDPSVRAQFDSRYQAAFGERPPPLAGIAYDAAALASRSLRDAIGSPPVGEAMLGADGPIRLTADGLAQRGLAIFAIDPSGEPRLIQPAPVPGSPGT